ncbi:MAG: DNA methylase, partial [Candidatus Marinimicrobia bacterium]|nr:DNA methylase [Candidatus Neomarinimicrobiota bacterium]
WCLSVFWEKATKYPKYQNLLRFLISSYNMSHSTIMTRVIFKKNSNKPVLTSCQTGTIYISSLPVEKNIIRGFEEKLKTIMKLSIKSNSNVIISTQSITNFKNIPSNSIDYIFTDPPFGANLMYSELSFIWEAWLRVLTNNKKEAIINRSQHKRINDYTQIMTVGFKEMYRVLKPNRWITIEFHNSKASVWNSIQEAVTRAGFIISQVAVLDKQQGSFNQVTAAGAVENDLIINAYKPKEDFAEKFLISAGDGMEVDFIADQLDHLPIRPNVGRTEKMLYSKMLAHYVENGFKIRYDSANFYKLLSDNFTELDGYWFLDSQAKEYNEWKSGLSLDRIKEVLDGQQVLFVSDEKSALAWLYNLLHQPRTYSEIYTAYQQVATTTEDKIPELRDLLDNNFILEEGKHRRPVSREEREEINKNREKELDRAFNKLLKHAKEQKGKIRNIRQEALVHGFTRCYQEGRYQDILTIADKLYASTQESSGDIMDFVDIARIK